MLFFYLLNLFKDYQLLGMFDEVFGHILTYFALFFMSGALVLVDNGLHLAQYEIKRFLEGKERQKQKKL